MWLALTCGFFSCTCPAGPGGKRQDDRIQIRARLRAHIPALLKEHSAVFAKEDTTITEDAGTDYRFRIIVSRDCFVRLMTEAAMANHAHNFKNSVSERWGHGDPYVSMLHRVWHVGYDAQERERSDEQQQQQQQQRIPIAIPAKRGNPRKLSTAEFAHRRTSRPH